MSDHVAAGESGKLSIMGVLSSEVFLCCVMLIGLGMLCYGMSKQPWTLLLGGPSVRYVLVAVVGFVLFISGIMPLSSMAQRDSIDAQLQLERVASSRGLEAFTVTDHHRLSNDFIKELTMIRPPRKRLSHGLAPGVVVQLIERKSSFDITLYSDSIEAVKTEYSVERDGNYVGWIDVDPRDAVLLQATH